MSLHAPRAMNTDGLARAMLAPWLFRLLCLYPLAWALAFSAFVLRARLALGRWPAPNRPDPADPGFGVHQMALLLGEPGLFVLPFVLLRQISSSPSA